MPGTKNKSEINGRVLYLRSLVCNETEDSNLITTNEDFARLSIKVDRLGEFFLPPTANGLEILRSVGVPSSLIGPALSELPYWKMEKNEPVDLLFKIPFLNKVTISLADIDQFTDGDDHLGTQVLDVDSEPIGQLRFTEKGADYSLHYELMAPADLPCDLLAILAKLSHVEIDDIIGCEGTPPDEPEDPGTKDALALANLIAEAARKLASSKIDIA